MSTKAENALKDWAGAFLDGDLIEDLVNKLHDTLEGDNEIYDGQMMKFARSLQYYGKELEDAIKDRRYEELVGVVGEGSKLTMDGVLFEAFPPKDPTSQLDTAAVKKMFPESDYPELYKLNKGKTGFCKVTL